MKFLDEVQVEVAAGKGGNGCASFRREVLDAREVVSRTRERARRMVVASICRDHARCALYVRPMARFFSSQRLRQAHSHLHTLIQVDE